MNYDVIVVGAGPGGSSAANFLARQGISTLLLDKSTFPREAAWIAERRLVGTVRGQS
jgi:flavin-dependent dehydrogenase